MTDMSSIVLQFVYTTLEYISTKCCLVNHLYTEFAKTSTGCTVEPQYTVFEVLYEGRNITQRLSPTPAGGLLFITQL